MTLLALGAPEREILPQTSETSPPPTPTSQHIQSWFQDQGDERSLIVVRGPSSRDVHMAAGDLVAAHMVGRVETNQYHRGFAFTFDSRDPCRSSISGMVATIISQLFADKMAPTSRLYQVLKTIFLAGKSLKPRLAA